MPAPPPPLPPLPDDAKSILTDLARWDAATPRARRAAAEAVARREPDFALVDLETFSCGDQTHEVATWSHAKTGLTFVLLPGGTFEMGAAWNDRNRKDDESAHRVTLTRPFFIARTECTQSAYQLVTRSNPSDQRGTHRPVEMVSWIDAKAFCGAADLELPTEAQWEWACRAGTTTPFFCGDTDADLGRYFWNAEYGEGNHEVAQKQPNAFGLHDMGGNVEQWCADFYAATYPTVPVIDPTGPATGDERVIRGLRWRWTWSEFVRSAARSGSKPPKRNPYRGFRPGKTIQTD